MADKSARYLRVNQRRKPTDPLKAKDWRDDPDFVTWLISKGYGCANARGKPATKITDSTTVYMYEAFSFARGLL